jgi:hypothetical protein
MHSASHTYHIRRRGDHAALKRAMATLRRRLAQLHCLSAAPVARRAHARLNSVAGVSMHGDEVFRCEWRDAFGGVGSAVDDTNGGGGGDDDGSDYDYECGDGGDDAPFLPPSHDHTPHAAASLSERRRARAVAAHALKRAIEQYR